MVIFYFFTIAFRTVETLLNCIDARQARSASIFKGSTLCVHAPKKSGTRQSIPAHIYNLHKTFFDFCVRLCAQFAVQNAFSYADIFGSDFQKLVVGDKFKTFFKAHFLGSD